eukprot:1161308-Pelagomonas_calceolata.AAC.6
MDGLAQLARHGWLGTAWPDWHGLLAHTSSQTRAWLDWDNEARLCQSSHACVWLEAHAKKPRQSIQAMPVSGWMNAF